MANTAARPATFSPTKINMFAQCGERYLRRYHVGPRGSEPFSRPLERGKAAHAVLADLARRWRTHGPFADAELEAAVARAFARVPYPDAERRHRDDDAAEVLGQVRWGAAEFARSFGDAVVLHAETALGFTFEGDGGPPFRLEAIVDLVALHPDGVIEHRDWKTGRAELDDVQNLVTRIVTGRNAIRLAADCPSLGNDGIWTSVSFLAERRTWDHVYSRDELRAAWPGLLATVRRVMDGLGHPEVGAEPWTPRPNGLCGWCPFEAVCSRNAVTESDALMADWLTGTASA